VHGRPRQQFQPNLEFTDEAYHILEAAATVTLHRMRLLGSEYVTKEDLIDHCWAATFFYVKDEKDLKKKMFLNAQAAMYHYIQDKFGARAYTPIGPADKDRDTAPFDVVSPRELDDPALTAALVDEWKTLPTAYRQVLADCVARGYSQEETAERLRDCQLAVLLLAEPGWLSPRDRRIVRGCLIQGRSKQAVARKLHVTRERVRQLLANILAAALRDGLAPHEPPPRTRAPATATP
jgi:DNA-directed RNA polymerase specialized sigma24 family protein